MTRINLVPPEDLSDQHLLAEYRELPRVRSALTKSLASNPNPDIPPTFRLGVGHVKFFYDKGTFLRKRHAALTDELIRRGFKLTVRVPLGPHPAGFDQDWNPAPADVAASQRRIQEKLEMKPGFYTWRKKETLE